MGFYTDRIFPLLLDTLTAGLRPQCQEGIQAAHGCVLEIGIGTGANLPFYTHRVGEVVGIEPSTTLLESVLKKGLISLGDEYAAASLPDGPDDDRMDPADELLSPCVSPRPPAQMGTLADSQRDSLCDTHWVSVADVAL